MEYLGSFVTHNIVMIFNTLENTRARNAVSCLIDNKTHQNQPLDYQYFVW